MYGRYLQSLHGTRRGPQAPPPSGVWPPPAASASPSPTLRAPWSPCAVPPCGRWPVTEAAEAAGSGARCQCRFGFARRPVEVRPGDVFLGVVKDFGGLGVLAVVEFLS